MDVLSQCCTTPTFGPGENLASVCIQHTDTQTFGQGMENSANMGNSGICRKASCKAEVSIGSFGQMLTAPAPLRLMRDPSQPKEVTSRSMLTSLDDLSVLSSFWAEERVSTCTARSNLLSRPWLTLEGKTKFFVPTYHSYLGVET